MLALPSAVGLIVLAEPIVAVLFQRGKFTHAATAAVVPAVQAYMLGVLPYSLVKVLSPAFYAVDKPRVPMIGSMAAVAVNLAFNALTYQRLGAEGLALGTTLAAVVNLLFLRIAFAASVGSAKRPGWLRDLATLAFANAVLGVTAWGAWKGADHALHAWRAHSGQGGGFVRALLLIAVIAVSFVVYVGALRVLRYRGAEELWQLPAKVARRLRARR
jgi:putative peptidoglycan lipid II flippase